MSGNLNSPTVRAGGPFLLTIPAPLGDLSAMALDTQQQLLIEQRVTNEGPSTGATYLLWFFLGVFSAHRFYLGRTVSAIAQIVSYLLLIGLIWWIIDGFLIPGMIREKKDRIRRDITLQMLASAPAAPAAA